MSVAPRSRSSQPAEGYGLTLAGALVGLLGGGLIGLLLALTIEGDPEAGMANLGLMLAVVGVVVLLALLGAPLGVYALLRATRQQLAGRTAVFLLGLQGIWLLLMFVLAELAPWNLLVPLPLVLSLVARYGAMSSIGPQPSHRIAAGGVLVVPVLAIGLLIAGQRVVAERERARQTEDLRRLPVDVYLPSYVPDGYPLRGLKALSPDTDDPERSWVRIQYRDRDGAGLLLDQVDDGDWFSPPESCFPTLEQLDTGDRDPNSMRQCHELYRTTSGGVVYKVGSGEPDEGSYLSAYYYRIGSTVIFVDASPRIEEVEIRRIIESLDEAPPEKLRAM